MRDLLNLLDYVAEEKTKDGGLGQLKTQIIGQVKKTDDEELLQRIYTVLNKTGLVDRIGLVLSRDTDTKSHVQQLTDMIVDVPGTYEEKSAFVKGYPDGYVDVEKMLSGEYVTFDQLLVGKKGAPIEFVRRVFDSLKQVTFGGAKGPGEFALAVLSPHIKITGRGDLNIDNKIIEVKASMGSGGGRIGTAGLLGTDNIPEIIKKYIPGPTPRSLNLKQLKPLMDSAKLPLDKQKKLCQELFQYVFRNKADVSDLVQAVVSGQNPSAEYIKANYKVYQEETNFDGMMLMNFEAGALKYFTDPAQMAGEIYASTIYLISSNPGYQTRLILAPVALRPSRGGGGADATQAPDASPRSPAEPVDLDQVISEPRLTGPGARAARSRSAPKTTAAVLGREKRRR
mgnify:CR=1 FL=1